VQVELAGDALLAGRVLLLRQRQDGRPVVGPRQVGQLLARHRLVERAGALQRGQPGLGLLGDPLHRLLELGELVGLGLQVALHAGQLLLQLAHRHAQVGTLGARHRVELVELPLDLLQLPVHQGDLVLHLLLEHAGLLARLDLEALQARLHLAPALDGHPAARQRGGREDEGGPGRQAGRAEARGHHVSARW